MAITTASTMQPASTLSISQFALGVYWREICAEYIKLLRNRAYSLAVIGFPVIFYLMFGSLNRHAGPQGHAVARYLLAGYSCFGAIGAALFGIGNGLAYERGHGWLELNAQAPCRPWLTWSPN